ncbi:unnamed protein product [Protopolystoma xenopodis]|uniref:Uncharacterized protein n=1 Tax=Protopolystoma xenopodis TaxID=117903 RepID=A0A3S5A8D7_9PLAT|nr:unnamed protein product [Protopolystoma xenopodis]
MRRGPMRTNLQPQHQDNASQPPVEPTYESLLLASSNNNILRDSSKLIFTTRYGKCLTFLRCEPRALAAMWRSV